MKEKKSTCKKQEEQGEQTRNSNGTFKSGTSGNPNGRPRGAINKVVSMVREAAESIALPKLIERASKGDMESIRLLFTAGIPRLKPIDIAESVNLNLNGTNSEKLQNLLELVACGELAPTKAVEISSIISKEVAAIDIEDLIGRIERLEKQANKGK